MVKLEPVELEAAELEPAVLENVKLELFLLILPEKLASFRVSIHLTEFGSENIRGICTF